MFSPEVDKQNTCASRLKNFNNGFIDRILILFQPVGDIVGYNTSIMGNSKVSILVSLRLRFQENWKFTKGCLQLFFKAFVCSFWEKRFFFKNGPNSHGLLKHYNSSSKVHSKVNHFPVNSFFDIFFLFNNKHVMIEELLKFLVHKIDRDLFKTIVLKYLKPCNVQHCT